MAAENALRIAPAREADVPLVLEFIRKLADYEKLAHQVVATEEDIRSALFGARPAAECAIAWRGAEPAGFALYFQNFSTFAGRPGIYLEDLFVDPPFRGQGIGKALLFYLARLVRERGCGRLQWAVLDWNQPAIDFYRSLGAVLLEQWTVFRLEDEALDRLVAREA